jgi:hypothetical protein
MSTEVGPQADRILFSLTRDTATRPLTEAQLNAVRAELAGRPNIRNEVIEALNDPTHPAADRALVAGLEKGIGAYLAERAGYSGLRQGQRIGQLDLWIDRDVNVEGPGRGFRTLDDAQSAARTVAAGRDRDAAVFRAPDGSFVMHPVTDLGRLGAGNKPVVHDLERLGGYRLISLATDQGMISLANDSVAVDTPYAREVRTALHTPGRPIAVVTGHGFVEVSKGKQPDGSYASRVGGELLQFTNFTSADMQAEVRSGRVEPRVLFMLGCNTGAYQGTPTQMSTAFVHGDTNGRRAFVGSEGFMQMGADVAGAQRMLANWRQNPSWTLRRLVDQENGVMRRNLLQDAQLVIRGNENITYDELMRDL